MKIYPLALFLSALFPAGASHSQTLPVAQAIGVLCTPVPTILVSATSTSVCSGFTTALTASGANTYTWTGTTLTTAVVQQSLGAGAGIYTVMGTNSAGCTDQTTMFIGMAPPLNIQVAQSSGTTCIASNFPKYSKPVNLSASGAATYAWFPYDPNMPAGPQATVRPAASTCYTVAGYTAICSGSAVVCVNVIPQFNFNVAPPLPVMCLGAQTQLSVANISTLAAGPASAFTYSWTEPLNAPPVSMSSSFASAVLIFPQNTCTYSVEVYDAKGCASLTGSVTVTVLECTGLAEVTGEQGFKLYPSPVNDQLYIRSGQPVNLTLEMINVLGKVLIRESIDLNDKAERRINTEGLSRGIYFVRFHVEGREPEIIRFIKE